MSTRHRSAPVGAVAAARTARPREGGHIDFDIHGMIGIRLVDASPSDEAAMLGQLGDLRGPLSGPPDLTVRFVERLPTPDLCYVEAERSGFTDDGFLLLHDRRAPARVRIPFDRLGDACEITCESGPAAVPLLHPIIKLTALRRGIVPVHASAFELHGTGVLVAGWAHGGKTTALLAFAAQGARYVGDDLVLLSEGGRRMAGLRAPIEMSDWQLAQLQHVRTGWETRLQVRAGRWLDAIMRQRNTASPGPRLTKAAALVRAVRRRLRVRLAVETLFGESGCHTPEPQRIFLAMSHAAPDIRISPTDPVEIAERMVQSFRHEMAGLFEQYLAFRFAFPSLRNEAIETGNAEYAKLLRSALRGRQAYVIRHPCRVRLGDLHAAMLPFCAPDRAARASLAEALR